MIFELARERKFGGEQSGNRVFLSRNYRLIVAPWKFDVFKTNTLVLMRTSNFQRANISR